MNFPNKGRQGLLPTLSLNQSPKMYGPYGGNNARLSILGQSGVGQSRPRPMQNKKPYFSDPLVLSRVYQVCLSINAMKDFLWSKLICGILILLSAKDRLNRFTS